MGSKSSSSISFDRTCIFSLYFNKTLKRFFDGNFSVDKTHMFSRLNQTKVNNIYLFCYRLLVHFKM